MELVERYCTSAERLEPKSVVIVGYQLHWVEGMNLAGNGSRRYVYALGPNEAADWRAKGYQLYYTPAGRGEVAKRGGNVDRFGAVPLPEIEDNHDHRRVG